MSPTALRVEQTPELVLACALLKKFLKEWNFTTTADAFEVELKNKRWKTGQKGLLKNSGYASLEDVLARLTQSQLSTPTDPATKISSSQLKRKAPVESSGSDTSDRPSKKIKQKGKQQPDGTYSSGTSSPSSLSSSTSTSGSSTSSSSTSSSSSSSPLSSSALSSESSTSSESESSSATHGIQKGMKQVTAKKAQTNKRSPPLHAVSESSSDSVDSNSGSESSFSTDLSSSDREKGLAVSVPPRTSTKAPDEDQAASNSSGTVQGDKKTSPESLPSEDTPQERRPTKLLNKKKHIGARPTPLAQMSSKVTADSHISNAYISYDYADRAYNDLSVTRGKNFTKEKNKKKRGSYRGGAIDTSGGKAFKFDD